MSNNILTKTQALSNLDSVGMPHEESLKMTGLTNDTSGVSKKWEENLEEKERKVLEQQKQQTDSNNEENN